MPLWLAILCVGPSDVRHCVWLVSWWIPCWAQWDQAWIQPSVHWWTFGTTFVSVRQIVLGSISSSSSLRSRRGFGGQQDNATPFSITVPLPKIYLFLTSSSIHVFTRRFTGHIILLGPSGGACAWSEGPRIIPLSSPPHELQHTTGKARYLNLYIIYIGSLSFEVLLPRSTPLVLIHVLCTGWAPMPDVLPPATQSPFSRPPPQHRTISPSALWAIVSTRSEHFEKT